MIIETARVIQDDEESLVVWKPTGSMGLVKRGVNGESARYVPLAERFSRRWKMAEAPWRGPGIVREVSVGMPWSLWWFFTEEGDLAGVDVNVELPHQRPIRRRGLGDGRWSSWHAPDEWDEAMQLPDTPLITKLRQATG